MTESLIGSYLAKEFQLPKKIASGIIVLVKRKARMGRNPVRE